MGRERSLDNGQDVPGEIVSEILRLTHLSEAQLGATDYPTSGAMSLLHFIDFYRGCLAKILDRDWNSVLSLDDEKTCFSLLIRLLTGARTVAEALRLLADFGNIAWRGIAQTEITCIGGRTHICLTVAGDRSDETRLLEIQGVATSIALLDWLTGAQITDVQGHFASCGGISDETMALIFPYQKTFEASGTSASIPTRRENTLTLRTIDEAEAIAKAWPIVSSGLESKLRMSDRVRAILRRDIVMKHRLTSLDHFCGMTNMPSATLRRHLLKEGTNYRRIRDEVLNEIAKRWLARSDVTLTQVAELLGFSDPPTFRKSFERWNGMSPARYRHERAEASYRSS